MTRPAVIVELCDRVVDQINLIDWIDGLSAKRVYQSDIELAELEKTCLVYPVNESFNRARGSRDVDDTDRAVGVTITHRLTSDAIEDIDQWAAEATAIRDHIIGADIRGFDNYEWNNPAGELFHSDWMRKQVFVVFLEITYGRSE